MVEVRPAREDDAPHIAEIYVETWRNSYAGVIPDRVLLGMSVDKQTISWTRAIKRGREFVMVADDADAGVVAVGSGGGNRDRASKHNGEIYALYVAADHQDQGVGRDLLGGMFQALLDREITGAVVWVLTTNPARFFYEAVGGTRAGEREEKLWGVTLHETAYAWPDLAEALSGDGLNRQVRRTG